MSKSEHRIQDEIRLALSQHGIVIRLNSGRAYGGNRVWDQKRNQYILTDIRPIALAVKGTPDLLFLGENGNVVFIEVKDDKGRVRLEQQRFIEIMHNMGIKAGVCRSVEDALELIK